MFDFLGKVVNETANVIEDTIDVGIGIATLGEYGDISKAKVSKLIATGLTIYEISELTGWSADIIEEMVGKE